MSNQDINELPTLKVNVPSFLLKTYEILENSSLSHIIGWNQEGNAFIVFNTNELASKVLANYFKHKNYPSFLRQLNMYNFKKTKNQYGQSEFRHKWFRRGLKYEICAIPFNRSMLQYIRRRNQEESEQKMETKDNNQELDNYKREHEEMRLLVRDIQNTQSKMQADFVASAESNATVRSSNNSIQQVMRIIDNQSVQIKCNNSSIKNLIQYPFFWQKQFQISPKFVTNFINPPIIAIQIGDILKNSYEEPSPGRSESNYIVPYNENNQYNTMGSPYSHYQYNSPIHYLFARQNQYFCFQFDPNVFSYNRQHQQQQLALPAPNINSYLPSNNYSLQSSAQNSPYRIASPSHTSTTDSKDPEKFSLYQPA
ncbi:unnamed protein product (macronuclear) [Paramecium tetraurelia]|uniref:HSF-type DNA-binding domain-containing protein n=1 Tax=Paramecium tetraurelia TaxID=5888 RepID=A0D2L2_PARTE|nr:uncharacterized protein GSPATT00012787001 [Paramecium tetraurelia]CAK77279.1 unnamed protein product [Paramecium tetraurelia]|eukprot:XP_001444676.1 hypothetical protein (macronuclear) [Paramecium tetraurelia strain d4-2]